MTISVENWLSLDLSSPVATLALHRLDAPVPAPRLLEEATVGHGYQHSERLIPALEALLARHRLDVTHIDRFVTTYGPGSFTGLRIAMATLKAFVMVAGKPLELVGASEARALGWLSEATPQPRPVLLNVVTHVAADRFVLAEFRGKPDGGIVSVGEKVVGRDDLAAIPVGTTWLVDEKTPADCLPGTPASWRVTFPLRARHLGAALPLAASRRTLATAEEWIAAGPLYFGDTKF